jgi:hypothetical protein
MEALWDALTKNGRKLLDVENYPQSRNVVSVDLWQHSYMRMRADSQIQQSSIKKEFGRQKDILQKQDFIRSYDNYVWLVQDEDRQDK